MHTVTKIVQDRVYASNPRSMSINCDGPISAIALSKDASQVVVGGRTVFKIYCVDEDKFEERHNLRVGKHINLNYCASDIAWNHIDDNILATGATNGAVVIWDLNKTSRCKQDHVFQEHKRTVNRVCFHENEHRLLLSASQDGSMKLFDIRKKEFSQSFSIGSTSVRDIQFCPFHLSFFMFASADESGSIYMWDMRRPDKVERQFTAHSGPVFTIDWHQEDKNLFATAGRDKMIKIWDLSKDKTIHTIYSIASVARIRWRPQRKYHIASSALLVDCSINIWDIRRPYVPFATFDNHKDVATSIAFKNKDPHVMLSGSKDHFLSQHVFRDAKRPGEELVPAGLGVSLHGVIGQASSDRQGKMSCERSPEGVGGRFQQLLTKKTVDRTERFVDVGSSMSVFRDSQQMCGLSLNWMVESAKRYKLTGASKQEICEHNAEVAHSLGQPQVGQSWLLLSTLLNTHDVDVKPSTHASRTHSVVSNTLDLNDSDKLKHAMDAKPETDVEDRNMEGTSGRSVGVDSQHQKSENRSIQPVWPQIRWQVTRNLTTATLFATGNSDEETDDKELFDTKLSSIARGQINPDWDIFFGDGESGGYDLGALDGIGGNKQEWVLPLEAFQPRHEIHDREAPLEPTGITPQQQPGSEAPLVAVENVVVSSAPPTEGGNGRTSTSILTIDMEHMGLPVWDYSNIVADSLKHMAAEGDVQTPVCMLIVFKKEISGFVDVDLQEDWFLSYIELLGRFKLWTEANNVIKLSHLPQVAMLNQRSTMIHVNCCKCNRPLQRCGWVCDRCKTITNKCCLCHLPVKGLFLWCQGCSHGGHLQHVKDWFSRNIECPTGCGHICEYT